MANANFALIIDATVESRVFLAKRIEFPSFLSSSPRGMSLA